MMESGRFFLERRALPCLVALSLGCLFLTQSAAADSDGNNDAILQGRLFLKVRSANHHEESLPVRDYSREQSRGELLGFVLRVRNNSSIRASAARAFVWVKLAKFRRLAKYRLRGPETLEGYEAADFEIALSELPEPLDLNVVSESTYSVVCTNCGAANEDL